MIAQKSALGSSMRPAAVPVAGPAGRSSCHLPTTRRSAVRSRVVRVAAYKDATPFRQVAEAYVRDLVAQYNKEAPNYPKVRFVLTSPQTEMGDAWRLTGSSPELGRWVADIGPTMTWTQGNKWVVEVKLPPGEHVFKCILRRGDGSYQWEEGPNRVLQVREGAKVVQVDMVPQKDEVGARELVGAR